MDPNTHSQLSPKDNVPIVESSTSATKSKCTGKPRPRKGSVVRVTFLDHVEDGSKAIECVVIGRLDHTDRDSYVIDSWYIPDEEYDEDNCKRFSILKKVVSKLEILKPV